MPHVYKILILANCHLCFISIDVHLIICYNLSTSCDRKQLCITRGVIRNNENTVHPWWQPFSNPSAYPSNTRKNSYLQHFVMIRLMKSMHQMAPLSLKMSKIFHFWGGTSPDTRCIAQILDVSCASSKQLGQRVPTVGCWQDPFPQIRHWLVDHSRIIIFIKDYLHRSSLRLCRTS